MFFWKCGIAVPLAGFCSNPGHQCSCSALPPRAALLLKKPNTHCVASDVFIVMSKKQKMSFGEQVKPMNASPLTSFFFTAFHFSPRLAPHHLSFPHLIFVFLSLFLPPSLLPLLLLLLPGRNVAVWASVNCGLSAAAASSLEAQSQQGWSAGCSRLPPC